MQKERYTYHPMHMHLHAACDYGASMAMHMYNAQKLGMRYLWFTDHDTRTGRKQNAVTGFRFDGQQLLKEEPTGGFHGFKTTDDALNYTIDPQNAEVRLTLQASGDSAWQKSGIFFVSSGTRHTSSLAADVTLSMDVEELNITQNSRLIFDVKLSQRPPELENAHLLYVLGSTEGLEAPHIQIIPLDVREGRVVLPISEDVSEEPAIGGKDNAFDTLTVWLQARSGEKMTATVRDFQIRVEKSYEQVHKALKIAAEKAGKNYGVTPFVGFEISGAGEHKNCFCTKVPTIDYCQHNYQVSEQEAIRHVKAHGGIFAVNHPLASSYLKHKTFTPVEHVQIIGKMSAELIACKANGADLMEVGFPDGRNGFALEEYTGLWDTLSSAGLILTGYGCSDSHRDNAGWFEGNNFASFVGVSSDLSHPVAEEAFTDAMKKGRIYTADPVKVRGTVDFRTESGHPMGSVFLSEDTKEVPILFTAEQTRPGWQFRLIENGNVVETVDIKETQFSYRSVLKIQKTTVNFQRAELWDENGRCILLTNPMSLINTDLVTAEIPVHRLAKESET